ncbi:hypothetical protein [Vibrio fluvialis]|uniref:hypothetical protein n=1 Tax=Vibrio fluvialis TaxID=676 RepID=UPI0013024004|nr:hypothetical protein [Vibrio fluvialis]
MIKSLIQGQSPAAPLFTKWGEELSAYRNRMASIAKGRQPNRTRNNLDGETRERVRQMLSVVLGEKKQFSIQDVQSAAVLVGRMIGEECWDVTSVCFSCGPVWTGLMLSTHINGHRIGVLFKETGAGVYCKQALIFDLPE